MSAASPASRATRFSQAPLASGASPDDVFVFPVSFSQQRLWFLHELEPDSSAYNLPVLLKVAGPLDRGALERALEAIVARHEILRTTFAVSRGEPVQVVAPPAAVRLHAIAVIGASAEKRRQEAHRLATEETRRPFDLARGPLFRAHLWSTGREEHILLLNMHHAVADGWSFRVLLAELGALYESFHFGRPSTLPAVRIQYADFAAWQRAWLSGSALEKRVAHWRERLADAPEALDLPCDRPRALTTRSSGATASRPLSAALVDAVRRFSQREGVTPFMTMLSAYALLLYRLTGREDVLIGSPIAGRVRPDLEDVIGVFINTVALRIDLAGNPTVRKLVGRVRDAALDAYAHQDLPIEKLVEALRPRREESRNPLFQVLFLHHRGFIQPFTAGPLRFSPLRVDRGGSGEDLSLFLIEREGEGLMAGIEYKTELFDEDTIQRMLAQYETCVEELLARPDGRIRRHRILPADERDALTAVVRGASESFAAAATLHGLFESQVQRTPEAPAAISGHRRLTYRELNARANRIARFLRRQGAGTETLVGIALDRSIDLVAGILGALKAGAAYLPLDPTYPDERLSLLRADSGTALILSRTGLGERPAFAGARVVLLDREADRIDRESGEDLTCAQRPESTAYVLYTSGSTGIPRGVAVPHAAIRNHMLWMQSAFPLEAADRVLQRTPISFDASVWEFFAPLISGAALVLGGPEDHRDVGRMLETARSHRVTVLQMVPGLLAMLLEEPDLSGCASVRRVFCGGAAISVGLRRRFADRMSAELVNLYGPTEATIDVTFAPLGETGDGAVPIGRPIANTAVHVLDAAGESLPLGVPGEIFVGGAALARGYLGRPEWTAERFVPDPFSTDPGARLYRTGDRGVYRVDGQLHYLGRLDDQVKIRGQRLEPAEIEATLARHPAVRECVVLARREGEGDPRLVAYVAANGADAPGPAALRLFLKGLIPEPMLPSAFVVLEALPRAPNGKIDRAALPAPQAERPAIEAGFLGARDDLEARIAAIWERTLGVRPIGVRDNFFDLGGHSFLAMAVFSEMEKAFGRRLPLATLFRAPTVEEIAAILREDGGGVSWSSLVPIAAGGSRPPFYCFHAVGGNVLTYVDLARRLGPDQPVYGLQAAGLDGRSAPHATVEEMARHYAAEMRRFHPGGPYAVGGTSAGGLIAYEVARQLEAAGENVGLVALFDTYGPQSVRPRPGVSAFQMRLYHMLDRFLLHFQNFLAAERLGKAAYIAAKSRRLGDQLRSRWRRWRRIPLSPVLQRVQGAVSGALRSYVPGPYGGRVTLFRANSGPRGYDLDPTLGWGALAAGGVEVHDVPGYHGALVYEPRVALLASRLAACLESAAAVPARSGTTPGIAAASHDAATA